MAENITSIRKRGTKQAGEVCEAHDPIEPIALELLEQLGEDPGRDGLLRTPHRMAEAFRTLTSGYGLDPRKVVNGALFDSEGYDEMVVVKNLEFYSLCEHHLLPFFGEVSVAYFPDKKIIGLSKIPRIVDVFARRLQVQERMTSQIAKALQDILKPKGVAVSASGFHLCMAMRGVEKQGGYTTTSSYLGVFKRERRCREDFLKLLEPGESRARIERV